MVFPTLYYLIFNLPYTDSNFIRKKNFKKMEFSNFNEEIKFTKLRNILLYKYIDMVVKKGFAEFSSALRSSFIRRIIFSDPKR